MRNYLARTEQRRIFWLFMPPAVVIMLGLGWLERSWLGRPEQPSPPQIDTAIARMPADPAVADAIVIEAEPEPEHLTGGPDELGASLGSLARVKDDTIFRGVEQDAWFQIWMTLRSADMPSLRNASVRRVSFAELFGQPGSYRGRLVRFRGTLHRLEQLKAPPNDHDITDYWQGWLEPEGGPASPIVVYFLTLPAGMPHGMKIGEQVEVIGYFFKRWAYAATDTVRTAPLVMAREPIWRPRPAGSPGGNPLGTVALVAMAGIVLITVLGIRAAGQASPPRSRPAPRDLSATLSDVPLFSPAQALRQLEESAADSPKARGHDPSEEHTP